MTTVCRCLEAMLWGQRGHLVHDREKQSLINNSQLGLDEISGWCKVNK